MANASPDMQLSVVNSAIKQTIVYVNQQAQLDFTLLNNSSGAVGLQSNSSVLQIFMPAYYTGAELQNMKIALDNWKFSVDSADGLLLLTYTGPSASLAAGASLMFSVTNATSAGPAGSDGSMNVNPIDMSNTPTQVPASLSIAEEPQPGNAHLSDTMRIALDNQGLVYVSQQTNSGIDPLQNTLFLTIRNTGSDPLYDDTTMWSGNPQATVKFIYGSTSGALAPDDDPKSPPIGSAWKIEGATVVDTTAGWQIQKPGYSSDNPHPVFVLKPASNNQQILGTGAAASVTFAFSNIIAFTPVGHTQMIVDFTGVMKNQKTAYSEAIFSIDVNKQNPPPTRGLINFFAPNPVVPVTKPNQAVTVSLRWTMFDVARVDLICSFPGINLRSITYPNFKPLAYDSLDIVIPGVTQSTAVYFTLQAFDGFGGYLNSMQFTAFLQAQMFVDPRDEQVYPVMLINNQFWMTQNLDYRGAGAPYGSISPQQEATYGRLYTIQEAQNLPAGWRVPTKADWTNLISTAGGVNKAYKTLIAGGSGSNGFNAQLGGFGDGRGNFSNIGSRGYYWTSSGDTATSTYAVFSSVSQQINFATIADSSLLSVRYVQDA